MHIDGMVGELPMGSRCALPVWWRAICKQAAMAATNYAERRLIHLRRASYKPQGFILGRPPKVPSNG